jgi:hypothetical protein
MITIEESFGIIQKLSRVGILFGIASATPDHFSWPLPARASPGPALR